MKRLLPLLAAFAAVAFAAGCTHKETGEGGAKLAYPTDHTKTPVTLVGKYGGNLTYEGLSDPKTFNYWVADDADSGAILTPLYDSLETRDSFTYKFVPRLADLPKISPDGLTYTYTLQPGLKWSDGAPLNADDVIFTLDMLFDPKTETIMREGMLVDVVHPNGTITRQPFQYKKIDDRTVQFILPQKYAPAEAMFSFAIAPKHKLYAPWKAGQINSTYGINTPPSELVSSGPFIMSEYAPGQRIVYKPNPNFWKHDAAGHQLPYLDTFTYLITPDLNTMVLKFRSGDGDAIAMPTNQYPDLKKGEASGNYTVVDRGPSWGFNYVGFNFDPESKNDKSLTKLFGDVRFRQALAYAVNRQRICDDVFLGLAKPLYGLDTPADALWYDPNVQQYPYDLNKAKTLLAQMGLTPGAGGKLMYGGKPVAFTMYTNVENSQRKDMMTIIANDFNSLGLTVTPVAINFNDLIRRFDAKPYDWQTCVMGFTGGPEPHDSANIWRSSGPSHPGWPKEKTPATPWEAQVDKILIAADHETDYAKRRLLYNQFQEIIAQQVPVIFTVNSESLSAVRNHYGNIKPSGLYSLSGDVVWNIEEIFDTNSTRVTR